jgi:hypothetical protein
MPSDHFKAALRLVEPPAYHRRRVSLVEVVAAGEPLLTTDQAHTEIRQVLAMRGETNHSRLASIASILARTQDKLGLSRSEDLTYLDLAYDRVNALGSPINESGTPQEAGYLTGIQAALEQIMALGGRDPLTSATETKALSYLFRSPFTVTSHDFHSLLNDCTGQTIMTFATPLNTDLHRQRALAAKNLLELGLSR